MLLSVTVENFLSFKEKTKISFEKKLRSGRHNHKYQVFSCEKLNTNILRFVAFFGANGAGKSNIIRAVQYVDRAIITGTPDRSENHSFFNNDNYIKISLEFLAQDIVYRYALKICGRDILCEQLLFKDKKSTEYTKIFSRSMNEFKLHINNDVEKEFKPVALSSETKLSLHELANNKHLSKDYKNNEFLKHIKNVDNFFAKDLAIITPTSQSRLSNIIPLINHSDENFKDDLTDFIKRFDIGIKDISMKELRDAQITDMIFEKSDIKKDLEKDMVTKSEGLSDDINGMLKTSKGVFHVTYNPEKKTFSYKAPVTHHVIGQGSEKSLYCSDASHGTQRLMDLFPLFNPKIKPKVVLIDELENSLHPDIVINLVDTFTQNEDLNNHQLILATHENALFHQDIIRKDGIFIVEKDDLSQSYVQNLVDISNERFDKNLRRSHELGLYGGTPRIR